MPSKPQAFQNSFRGRQPSSGWPSSQDGHPHGGKRADSGKQGYVLPCSSPAGETVIPPPDIEYTFLIRLGQFRMHAHHWINAAARGLPCTCCLRPVCNPLQEWVDPDHDQHCLEKRTQRVDVKQASDRHWPTMGSPGIFPPLHLYISASLFDPDSLFFLIKTVSFTSPRTWWKIKLSTAQDHSIMVL